MTSAPTGSVLPREFFERDALAVAPQLLNILLVANGAVGRIVEVEAYEGTLDPASHAFRGPTKRTTTMFGEAGHLYVYFTYGMHYCANVVCREPGVPAGVLLRALRPVSGIETMRARRPKAVRDEDLCSGPARLCQALAITTSSDGADVVTGADGIQLLRDTIPPPKDPLTGPRVGLSARSGPATLLPWRFGVPGEVHLSRRFGAGSHTS